jgi:hypothetical protein
VGAFGILEGSERIYLGDRLLRPGVDYLMDPELGMVTLLQPEFLLARSSSDRLRITWEQASLFRPRPTTLVGGSAEVALGEQGAVNLLGLYQAEQEVLNRPRFGAEPASAGMLGLRTELAWARHLAGPAGHALLGAAGRTCPRGGELRIEAEAALSLPNPNVSGDAFLDDFDAGDERSVSLLASAWHLGSAPASGLRGGACRSRPPSTWRRPLPGLAAQLDRAGNRGRFHGRVRKGSSRGPTSTGRSPWWAPRYPGAGLLLSFGRDPGDPPPEPRWRSITTLLGATGADLSQTEFLDFYVAEGDALTLVLDLGSVSEDAFFIDENGRTSGFRDDTGRAWGLGPSTRRPIRSGGRSGTGRPTAGASGRAAARPIPGRVYAIGDRMPTAPGGTGGAIPRT